MKIAVSTVDFFGAVIREGTIKLQPHIIKKIVNFNEEELETKKGLRSFLGILIYARNHIPKLGILLRLLYEKTNAHGDKRLKPSECTGEMKQLAATTLYSVEEVLQSPYAFQKNMKITCEEIMKISNHFQESSQKLSLHMKNQEHYTDITSSKPIKPQSEWINLMHGGQSPKTLKFQQQKKQSKPCEAYKQSYNVRPKSALENPLKITTGPTKEKTSEFKTKKPEESSLNWKPLHNDWAATTSKPKEVQANNPKDNKCRYNRKGFLKDYDSSDDLIFIVDPGWDDYCLQELKLNRPVPCCPDAR
ncbi:hypothetical protein Tco_1207806 [Tanacetum coccineum]